MALHGCCSLSPVCMRPSRRTIPKHRHVNVLTHVALDYIKVQHRLTVLRPTLRKLFHRHGHNTNLQLQLPFSTPVVRFVISYERERRINEGCQRRFDVIELAAFKADTNKGLVLSKRQARTKSSSPFIIKRVIAGFQWSKTFSLQQVSAQSWIGHSWESG